MNVAKAPLLCLLCLGISCWDRKMAWVEDLVTQLQCGMSLTDVQRVTEHEIKPTTSQPDLGTHRVDGKWADVWLNFQEGRLVHVTAGTIDGLTSLRLSPKRNLCTGGLTFFLRLEWVEQLQGADIYLDGKGMEENASSGLIFELSAGSHELRVVKEGYESIVKRLYFGPEDPGEYHLDLTSSDLRPGG